MSWTGLRSVRDEIDLKKTGHQQQQPKEQKQTHRRETHTQTQAQGETPQHSQSAFPPIPETRLQVSDHWRRAILPMSPDSNLAAKESAVHCELHYLNLVRHQHTPWLTKVKADSGLWPSIPVPLLLSKCNEQAASDSKKHLQ